MLSAFARLARIAITHTHTHSHTHFCGLLVAMLKGMQVFWVISRMLNYLTTKTQLNALAITCECLNLICQFMDLNIVYMF